MSELLYKKAIQACLEGNAVLMTGAGFSYNARNMKNEKLGQASNLIKFLCQTYNIPYDQSYSLDEVASYILEDSKKRKDFSITQMLIRQLQDYYQTNVKGIEEEHKIIASIPWTRIYTTNYDDVFENAYYSKKGKAIATFNAYDDTSKVAKTQAIVHLNGYIRNLTVEKLNSEFKLTSFSYWQEEFKREKMFELLKQDLDNANVIIYIGTSLKYDFDISKLLNVDSYKEKTIFIDRLKSNFDISDSRKSYLGVQMKVGVEGFAKDIITAQQTFEPSQKSYDLQCFSPIILEKNIYEENNIQYLWDLLLYGKVNSKILQKNLNNDDYVISRDELSSINPREYKVINIHSNLGNGKTISLLKEAYRWSKANNVLILNKVNKNITNDLVAISKIKGHKILIIENYTFYQEVLKKMKIHLDDSYTIILTSRSFVNEQYENQIPILLEVEKKDIKSINLNYLSTREIRKISNLLEKLNLNEIKQKNSSQVKKIIGNNKSLSNILLDLLRSSVISTKIDNIYKNFEKNNSALQILSATMVNNFTNLQMGYSDLCSVVGITTNDIENIRNENIRELLNIGHGEITLQSPIFSRYLVSTQSLDYQLIETMKKILINANILEWEEQKRICEILISQSNIRMVFSGLESSKETSSISANVVRYFDDIVDLRNHKSNIFFWLQYGMACMDIHEYDRSENYLNISYDLAEQRNKEGKEFGTFQIDTQYARFILEKDIYSSEESVGSCEKFLLANKKLEKAIRQKPSQARLAYKQMVLYEPYLEKSLMHFSVDDISKAQNVIANHLKNSWFMDSKYETEEIKNVLERCSKKIIKSMVKLSV
ncbi:SIR2 family protein [Bacillus sp. OK048]|uniref:SIR2 family protein n=1 Tax=Bacillus sp. OK048 TaxID=1882761 RepID=UPI00087EFFE7|nr:SIR2 family protein [Bacillus sp. OK048]SDN59347.1 SIR2-like domain-containing protein [Bacillus sp. OK048]